MRKAKKILLMLLAGMLLSGTGFLHAREKPADGPVTHVVLVWLKDPGNAAMRSKFVAASKSLNDLPGIINRQVGIVMPSDRIIVDDTFDVGVAVTLKDKKALQAYMQNPKHKKIVQEQLKPLVNRIVAYDFISE